MDENELLGLLLNRGWKRFGVTNEMVIDSTSQRILNRADAALAEGIDPEAHYEILPTQAG